MANESALLSLAESLAQRLANAWTPELGARHGDVSFQAIGSGGLLADLGAQGAVLSIWPYRVTVNEQMRNLSEAQSRRRPGLANRPLALDVHLLLSIWSGNTALELAVFAWMLRELHREPILDASSLSSNGGWAGDEVVQLIPAEITVEDMMRIWDAIAPSYRLSAPYVARIVQLDVEQPDALPVLTRRFDYGAVPS
jgi:hypothetical protein